MICHKCDRCGKILNEEHDLCTITIHLPKTYSYTNNSNKLNPIELCPVCLDDMAESMKIVLETGKKKRTYYE